MKKSSYLIGACTLALVGSGSAFAQSGAPAEGITSQDIVVTATRREQRLQEVPLAVTALSSETLRDRGISSAADLGSGKVPGLNINSMFGSETAIALNIRGYGTSDPSQGTNDQPAAFYIDGINLPRAQGMAMDLITPERVEVLRGPQGQLFGRNAEAGAIQIVSKRPTGKLNGDFSGGYGNFNTRYAKGRLDLPEIAGFRVQISGSYRAHDGYIKNTRNPLLENIQLYTHPLSSFQFPVGNYDQDLSQLNSHGWRVAVERDFGPLNVFYTYDNSWAKDDQGLTQFTTSSAYGTISNPNGRNDPALLFTTQGMFSQAPLDFNAGYPTRAPYAQLYVPFITKSFGHSLTLTYNASDALTLKSITGLRTSRRQGGNDLSIALSAVNPFAGEYLNSKTISEEVQAIYSKGSFNLTAGAIYFQEKVIDERDSGFATNCFGPLSNLNPRLSGNAPCDTSAGVQPTRQIWQLAPGFKRSLSNTESYALYGQASFKPAMFDDKLELVAGLRYSNDTKNGSRVINGGVVLATPVTNVAKTDRVDPAFMIRYQWTPDLNTYIRVARGFRDGGANVRSNVFNAFDAESLMSYEIGLKSQWFDRRVTLNIAGFHNIVEGQQIPLQSQPAINPSITETFNSPSKFKTTGLEVELSIRPAAGLSISANYTYLDSNTRYIGLDSTTLKSFVLTGYTFRADGGLIPSAADLTAHPNATYVQLAPVGSPKHSGSVSLDYTYPVGSLGRLAFHGEWVRSGDAYVAAPTPLVTVASGGTATPKPTYVSPISTNRVNARLALKDIPLAGGTKAELSLWGKNILNHVDAAHGFAAGNSLNITQTAPQSAVYLQPPRTYGVEMRIQF